MAMLSPFEYDVCECIEKLIRETTALRKVNPERIRGLRALARQARDLREAVSKYETTHGLAPSFMLSLPSEPSGLGPSVQQATRQSRPEPHSSDSSDSSEVGGKSTSQYYDPSDSTDSDDSEALDLGDTARVMGEFWYKNFSPNKYIHIVEELVKSLRIWIMELEEAKYPGIDFNAPLKKWTKKEKHILRSEIRVMSYEVRKRFVLDKMVDLNARRALMKKKLETGLAVEMIELMLQDIFLLRMIPFKDVVFPVQMENIYDWKKVSKAMNGTHNPAECQEAWFTKFHPNINRREWTKAENRLLGFLADAFNLHHWDQISMQMHTIRSQFQCFVQYRRFLYKDKNLMLKRSQPETDDEKKA